MLPRSLNLVCSSYRYHTAGRRILIQTGNGGRPGFQCQPLIDVALVRHLPGCERWWPGQNRKALDAPRRSAGGCVEPGETGPDRLLERLEVRTAIGLAKTFERRRRRPQQRADEWLILPCDDGMEHIGRACAHDRRPQYADRHPGAAIELEVLGHAPVEHQPLGRVLLIDEPHRIAEFVKSFLIERSRGFCRIVVI